MYPLSASTCFTHLVGGHDLAVSLLHTAQLPQEVPVGVIGMTGGQAGEGSQGRGPSAACINSVLFKCHSCTAAAATVSTLTRTCSWPGWHLAPTPSCGTRWGWAPAQWACGVPPPGTGGTCGFPGLMCVDDVCEVWGRLRQGVHEGWSMLVL